MLGVDPNYKNDQKRGEEGRQMADDKPYDSDKKRKCMPTQPGYESHEGIAGKGNVNGFDEIDNP